MKLRSMQRAHERIMLNITWRDHKTAEWIREQTKLRDILETISKAKWTWAGHLTRRTDNRWTTKLTFWQPRDHTRNKGRPKFRWRDDLDKFRKHWHRDASDRLRWRQMGKAYVQLRTFKGCTDDKAAKQIPTVTDSLESDHYCTKSYFNASVSKPSNSYRTVRNIANIDRRAYWSVG